MKYILVIGDGMADDPIPELGEKTPLQYANIPTLDKLASAGIIGSASTVPEGMQAGSDTAILSIFGSDPQSLAVGRATIEAAAMNIHLPPGDIAYRMNMTAIEDGDIPFKEKKILSHSAGSISGAESDALVRELFDSPGFREAAESAGIRVYPGSSFRHIAVQSVCSVQSVRSAQSACGVQSVCSMQSACGGKEPTALRLTPPHDHLDETLGQHLPRGGENAAVLENLMRLAHDFLENHPINTKRRAAGKLPANCIWFWAEGTAISLPNFTEKYKKTGSVISAVPLCQGIGVLIGLEKVIVEGATGELHTNYEGKVDAAIEALKTHDFTTIHIEAPDECTHNGDLKGKLQAIEWIDSRVVAPLVSRLEKSGDDFRMLVMSDHRTLLSTRGHDGGPVPYILYDSRADNKSDAQFNEKEAANGAFIADGTELMGILFEEVK